MKFSCCSVLRHGLAEAPRLAQNSQPSFPCLSSAGTQALWSLTQQISLAPFERKQDHLAFQTHSQLHPASLLSTCTTASPGRSRLTGQSSDSSSQDRFSPAPSGRVHLYLPMCSSLPLSALIPIFFLSLSHSYSLFSLFL